MRLFLAVAFLALALPALAQQQVVILPLSHRTVEDVLPVLEPLLEPGGALSGMSGQLIIRTSPSNLEDLKKVLATIDRPPRQLLIHVSQTREMTSRTRNFGVSGSVNIGDDVRVVTPGTGKPAGPGVSVRGGGSGLTAYGQDTRRSKQGKADQFVRVMDGGQAFIEVGRSLAVPFRSVRVRSGGVRVSEGVVYRDVGQGFYAVPRLAGRNVTVEITPRYDSLKGGSRLDVETQTLTTTVTGMLGEWIEVGGSAQGEQGTGSGLTGVGETGMSDTRGIWLMIEEAP
jgi:hypothetical protein